VQLSRFRSWSRSTPWVVAAIVTATAAKLALAATSTGTNDVLYWIEFAQGVDLYSPIGIYGNQFAAPYNHGPLTGWLLVAVNQVSGWGPDIPFLIRVPASLADALAAWIVFRLLLERKDQWVAALAAIAVVWSPALVVISGFHGNTDPVVVALSLASFWLLTRTGKPLIAGVAVGAAVSLKLVAAVVIPWLVFLAYLRGRSALARLVAGGATVFLLLWVPVLVLAWPEFSANVLAYKGVWLRQWGLAEFLEAQDHLGADLWLHEHGLYWALLAAAAPFLVLAVVLLRSRGNAWRGEGDGHRLQVTEVAGFGMAWVTLLVLMPAWGMQYLAWGVAAVYLVSVKSAWLFNVFASWFVLSVYAWWSGGGGPWRWDLALAVPFTLGQHLLMAATWTCLVVVWVDGFTTREKGVPVT
jgi:hypothetical protein